MSVLKTLLGEVRAKQTPFQPTSDIPESNVQDAIQSVYDSATTPTTTRGDIIRRGASADERLAVGTSGYALISDGTDPAWTGFTQAGTSATTRTWQAKARERVSVTDYGATGDGVTDDSASIQLALNYAATLTAGCEVYFPRGRYLCANNSATRLQIKSSVRIVGEGMRQSVIVFNDSASVSRRDLLITDTNGAYHIEIEGIGFESDWGTGDYTNRSHLLELATTGNVTVTRCRFAQSRYMSLVLTQCQKATVTECEFYRGQRDGCRITKANHAVVSNNYFESICDDSIAIHTHDSEAGPSQNSATITGNKIVDGQGITCLGVKHTTITGNSITRAQVNGIHVGVTTGSTAEGNTAGLSINITGNVIDTVFQGTAFSASSGGTAYYIAVNCKAPTTNGSGYVGDRDGSGGIVAPWDYFYTTDTDASAPVAGNWFINISGNICVRTHTAATNYSDYGYGERYGRDGPVDPAITAAHLGSSYGSIYLSNHGQNVTISGNICWGSGYGIYLDGTSASAYLSWRDVLIANNQVGNFVTAGIYLDGEGIVTVRGNAINGDPLHAHADRTANGTWGAGYTNHTAVWVVGGNAIFENNEIRNVGEVFTGASPAQHRWLGNVLACDPSVVGYNASNIGIARVLAGPTYGATYLIEDGDPANATYGEVLNACVQASSAMPASGEYVIGHFVLNSAPSATTPYGWLRLTTGSGHTLNTDWLAVDPVEMPGSSTDNALPRFDGTTGRILQGSSVVVDDSNNMSGVVDLAATTINLGHASDTTLARVSAGVASIEGVTILTTATGQPLDADLTSWAAVTRAAGFDTFTATPSSANLASLVTDETGSGALVFGTSPTLVTPAIGTPSSGTLTNCTGLPLTGLVSDTTTALGLGSIDLGHASDTTLSRVSAGVAAIEGVTILTTATGQPLDADLTSWAAVTRAAGFDTFTATPSSANLAAIVSDETGSGALVFATSPTLVTPALGTPSSGTLTNCTGLPVAGGGTGASTDRTACQNLATVYLLAHSAAGIASTNTTSEEVLATVAVPAGALGANGFLVVDTSWTLTNSGNNKTMRSRFGASGAGTGGTAFGQVTQTTAVSYRQQHIISNRNATNSQVGASGIATTAFGSTAAALPTAAIDTTAASEVVISSQKATGTETCTLEQYTVWLYYKA
jgi:hypothetical protein